VQEILDITPPKLMVIFGNLTVFGISGPSEHGF